MCRRHSLVSMGLSIVLALAGTSAGAAPDGIANEAVADRSELIVVGMLTGQRLIMVRQDGSRTPIFALAVERVVTGTAPRSKIIHLSMDTTLYPPTSRSARWHLRADHSGLPGMFVGTPTQPSAKTVASEDKRLSAR